MTRDAILQKLRTHQAELQAQGILHAALFGSVARGDDRTGSDIDVLVDLDRARIRTVYDYVGVRHAFEDLLGRPVDVVNRANMSPRMKQRVQDDEIPAF